MGLGDPDHRHPLTLHHMEKKEGFNCFRCELPFKSKDYSYGCDRCNHFVHRLCFDLPQNMTHPHHPQHSLTLSPSQITENCNQCLEPFVGGYAYHCQTCFKFNLHLKCFVTLNLEAKHCHTLSLYDYSIINFVNLEVYCRICGLPFDHSNGYIFGCYLSPEKACLFFIHFECTFIQPTVKHRHVHELTFQYNFPERSKVFDCDVCLNEEGGELDRTLSYYYCERCDYIAHVRCVTSQPAKVTTEFDHFVHEHPMICLTKPDLGKLTCAACRDHNYCGSLYFCSVCNYAIHKSCALFPRFIKHPLHGENHTLSLQNKDCDLVSCEFCTKERQGTGWILQCSDCAYAVHLSCARNFEHPLYKDRIFCFSSCKEKNFRCNACGELGDGFRMLTRENTKNKDLHVECFALPGQIDHGCHSHPLYLVASPTEIESYLSTTMFQCGICQTEADPDLWVYCCDKCRYFAHLKCVVGDLLQAPRQSSELSNLCCIRICEKEKFRVSTKLDHCSMLLEYDPVFLPRGFFSYPKRSRRDHKGQCITSDETGLDIPFMDVLHCPKCEQPICAQAYSRVYDWVHRNLKPDIYTYQNEISPDYESLALLDEKVVDELYCPICNLLIFPPTYSCPECQIFFHKSCAELPRKYTVNAGHTLVLHSSSMSTYSLTNCTKCKCPFKGYAYYCAICEVGFDVTCALGAPLLKQENQKHSFSATNFQLSGDVACRACSVLLTKEKTHFTCRSHHCNFRLHLECATLPSMVNVKRRTHQHPLVLEPNLDLSVPDYFCDVCEKELNPCIWVYRCSDICGDRATFHVSCIVTSKRKCHIAYDVECSYPHLGERTRFGQFVYFGNWFGQYVTTSEVKMEFPALAAALVHAPPKEQHGLLAKNLCLLIDELEHDYASEVKGILLKLDQAEILHLMESPGALRAKVAATMKHLTSELLVANFEDVKEKNDDYKVHTNDVDSCSIQ